MEGSQARFEGNTFENYQYMYDTFVRPKIGQHRFSTRYEKRAYLFFAVALLASILLWVT